MENITAVFFPLLIHAPHTLVTNLPQLHGRMHPSDPSNTSSRKTWRDVALKRKRLALHMDALRQYCVDDNFPTCHCAWGGFQDAYFFASVIILLFGFGDWHSKSSPPVRRRRRFIMSECFSTLGATNYQKGVTEIKVYLKCTGRSLRRKKKKEKPRSLFLWFLRVSVDAVQVWQWWCLGALRKEACGIGSAPRQTAGQIHP